MKCLPEGERGGDRRQAEAAKLITISQLKEKDEGARVL